MPNWIAYGLIATVFFALNTILYKAAQQKGNFSPNYGILMFSVGIIIVAGVFFLFKPSFEFEWKSSGLAIIAGAVWAIGMIAVVIAISQKADVARLAPIYNINTILAVLMGIIFLKEIPDTSQMFRVIAGAILIVVGAILVSI